MPLVAARGSAYGQGAGLRRESFAMTAMTDFSLKMRCGDCPIRHRAVCSHCDVSEIAHLDKVKYYRSFEAGQTIVWAGDPLDFVASIVTGMAKLVRTLDDGRTQMVGMLLPSDFLGRPGRAVATYTVTAVTDVVMCCFRRKPFEEIIRTMPHVSEKLLDMTLCDLDAAREWMLLLGRKTAREKTASLLVILARRAAALHSKAPQDACSIDLFLTREAIAEYLGLTLETVSRQFSAMKREGVIRLEGNRQVIVPDFAALQAQAYDDADA
jgi:CRP/FNR family transcriptional regulator, anaerobic regulatory protein